MNWGSSPTEGTNDAHNWPAGDGSFSAPLGQQPVPVQIVTRKLASDETVVDYAMGFGLGLVLTNQSQIYAMGGYAYSRGLLASISDYTPRRLNKTGSALWGYGIKDE